MTVESGLWLRLIYTHQVQACPPGQRKQSCSGTAPLCQLPGGQDDPPGEAPLCPGSGRGPEEGQTWRV